MGLIGELVVKITGNTAALNKSIDSTQRRLQKLSQSALRLGKTLSLSLTLPIVALGAVLAKAASNAEETQAKFDKVFGEFAKDTEQWAKDYSKSVNRGVVENLRFLSSVQDLFVPLGFARGEAAEMAKSVVKLATDIASFNNLPTKDVLRDIQGAMVGMHITVRKYGVLLNEATINQELLNIGIEGGIKAATDAEKVQARLNLIMKGSADAAGDALRTVDSFANQMRGLAADAGDLAESLGALLLPTLKDIIKVIRDWLQAFLALDDNTKKTILTIAALVAAIGPAIFIFGALLKAVIALKIAMVALAGPIGLVGIAITGIVVAIVLVSRRIRELRDDSDLLTAGLEGTLKTVEDYTRSLEILEERLGGLDDSYRKQQAEIEKTNKLYGRIKLAIGLLTDENGKLKDSVSDQDRVTVAYVGKLLGWNEGIQAAITGEGDLTRILFGLRTNLEMMAGEQKNANVFTRAHNELNEKRNTLLANRKKLEDEMAAAEEKAAAALKEEIEAIKEQTEALIELGKTEEEIITIREQSLESIEMASLSADQRLTALREGRIAAEQAAEAEITKNQKIEAQNRITVANLAFNAAVSLSTSLGTILKNAGNKNAVLQKALSIFTATILASQAVVNTLATVPFPLWPVAIPLAVAAGLAQIVAIASTPLPKLAGGGVFTGPAIIGEAGPEVALPLTDEVFGRLASAIENARAPDIINQLPADNRPIDLKVGVSIDGRQLNAYITGESRGGRIRIDKTRGITK